MLYCVTGLFVLHYAVVTYFGHYSCKWADMQMSRCFITWLRFRSSARAPLVRTWKRFTPKRKASVWERSWRSCVTSLMTLRPGYVTFKFNRHQNVKWWSLSHREALIFCPRYPKRNIEITESLHIFTSEGCSKSGFHRQTDAGENAFTCFTSIAALQHNKHILHTHSIYNIN